MRLVNLLLAAMFLVFAFVQINDPDPVIWILIYGAMAIVCILVAFRIYFRILMIVLLVALVGYSFLYLGGVMEWLSKDNKGLLFDDLAKMQYPYIEESREYLGLMICIIVLAVQLLLARKATRSAG